MTQGLPFVGIAPSLLKNPLKALMAAANEGDVVRLRVPKINLFLVHNPDLVKEVLGSDKIYIKGAIVKPFQKLFGTSVLTTEGEEWLTRRKMVQPAFHSQHLNYFTDIFRDETVRISNKWIDEDDLDIAQEMRRVTQSIIVQSLFGTNLDHIKEEGIDHILDEILGLMGHMIWSSGIPDHIKRFIPGERLKNRRFNRGKRMLHEVIDTLIKIKEKQTNPGDDLLGMLLNTRFDDGSSLSKEQIHNELITFFVAGHDTTAVALAWSWVLIDQHPEIRAKMYAELDQLDHAPTMADLPNLVYTRSVFYETLRLYPPAWFIPRMAHSDTSLGGVTIPQGSIVLVSPYLAHRHPKFWENPEQFNPERFAQLPDLRRPANFYPFGFGPRQCIARDFGLMEGALILANIAKNYELRLKYRNLPIIPQSGMTLHARQEQQDNILMTIYRR